MAETRLPSWMVDALAESQDLPITALHMAIVENDARKEHLPTHYTTEGWWPK